MFKTIQKENSSEVPMDDDVERKTIFAINESVVC